MSSITNEGTLATHPIPVNELVLTVEGITPLIVNQFSQKARQEIEDKQTGKKAKARQARDPDAIFRDSLHVFPGMEDADLGTEGAYFFPSVGFKAAAVRGVGFLKLGKDLSMTAAKGAFFVDNFPGPALQFSELVMRRDYVRLSTTSSLAYRGEFRDWSANLDISYWPHLISMDQLVAAFNAGGFACGIGEWRPLPKQGNSGSYGRFKVTHVKELRRA